MFVSNLLLISLCSFFLVVVALYSLQLTPPFDVRSPSLQIYGPSVGALRSPGGLSFPQSLSCQVTKNDKVPKATARVDFMLDNVDYTDTLDLAGVRILGIAPEYLAQKRPTPANTSYVERLQARLSTALGLASSVDARANLLKIVTIRSYTAPSSPNTYVNEIPRYDPQAFGTDVYFFARRNGRLISSREIYSLLAYSMDDLLAEGFGTALLFGRFAHRGGLHLFDDGLVARRRFNRQLLGDEVVAAIAFGYLYHVPAVAQFVDVFLENDFHVVAPYAASPRAVSHKLPAIS